MLKVHITQNWHVLQPFVFRYLDQEYIDAFFSNGELRLSSFETFSRHEDEERFDESEGIATISIGGTGGMIQAKVELESGYVLSGSTLKDDELMEAFGVDGYFRVDNSIAFAAAIGRCLPNFQGGFQGPCRYVDTKILAKEDDAVHEKLMSPEGKYRTSVLGQWVEELGRPAIYFLKLQKFRRQAEYRFIWQVQDHLAPTVTLTCPEAAQYCTRITGL